jgi:guanylate kinase
MNPMSKAGGAAAEGLLLIISGPSGSGKGSVVKELIDAAKGYALSVSATTRSPRAGEREGADYFFRTEDEFLEMIRGGELLEYTNYINHFYGTPKKNIEKMISEGKTVVLEIEADGALQVKKKYPGAVLIFMMPPTLSELTKRLTARKTESSADVGDRLKKALDETKLIGEYDYLVINDNVSETAAKIDLIVDAERMKAGRLGGLVEKFLNN